MIMKYKDLGTALSKEQMKEVKGGYHPAWGGCIASCGNGATFAVGCCDDAASLCNFGGGGLTGCSCVGVNQCQ